MAIYTQGAVVGRISGKVGGVVFRQGGGGGVVQSAPRHGAAESAAQTEIRANYLRMVAGWRGLSDAEREMYETSGRQLREPNRVGVPRMLTGWQTYVLQHGLPSLCDHYYAAWLSRPRRSQGPESVTLAWSADHYYVTVSPRTYPGEIVFHSACARVARSCSLLEPRSFRRWFQVRRYLWAWTLTDIKADVVAALGELQVGEWYAVDVVMHDFPYFVSRLYRFVGQRS